MKTNILDRFEELISRGNKNFNNSYAGGYTHSLSDIHFSECVAWKLSSQNLLNKVYGDNSEQYISFSKVFSSYSGSEKSQFMKVNIAQALGILTSAKEEFDLGFTHSIVHLLSIKFFDSIFEQAKELLKKGYKDPAAILGRVIIENTLKGLCKINEIQFNEGDGAQSFNEKLKNNNVFNLHQFKLCRTYIETGNNAAHGDFDEYSQDDIKRMFEYLENSLLITSV